jgi:hypothetical protein
MGKATEWRRTVPSRCGGSSRLVKCNRAPIATATLPHLLLSFPLPYLLNHTISLREASTWQRALVAGVPRRIGAEDAATRAHNRGLAGEGRMEEAAAVRPSSGGWRRHASTQLREAAA